MQDQDHERQTDNASPIYYVGIGASAGGLEALEAFFSQMNPDSGMAFIVIQHLSPDYKSMMVELLSKRTAMSVQRAEEGMRVEANSVYLIPPKKNLSIFHGKLLLSESDHNRGINLPIDVFMRSLADDQVEKAIGIILSGTGSDGVRGIRAIKEGGGIVFVQNEESARFDGMPRSALSTGLADFVLPPDEMPERLLSLVQQPYPIKPVQQPTLLPDEDGLTRIFALLRERTRVDFTYYKPSTVVRRIERRMKMNQIHDLYDYVKFMESYPGEIMAMYRELLIGVTSFFRDREVFDELEMNHLPRLFERVETREVRFWVAGCSTGEEAYTLAMLSREVLERLGKRTDVKIFATDLDRDAILRASGGMYPESIVADLPPGYLTKYFHRREDHHYQVDRAVREMVVFAQHNLIKDPPFTKIELVSCRNLLIYLQPILQRKAMELMNFSLNPQGILLLGSSETTGDLADLFDTLHQKHKIYASKGKRYPAGKSLEFSNLPEVRQIQNRTRFLSTMPARGYHEERLFDRLLQALASDYVPLAVVVNEQMEVLHILGEPDGYFRLPSGKMLNDVTKIAVRDLAIPLATGLQRVFKIDEELKYAGIRVKWHDESRFVQIRVRRLPGKKGQEPLAVVFIEQTVAQGAESSVTGGTPVYDVGQEAEQRIHDLEQELQFSRENLQATIEELETSNEELQATNEELLASNEELQSTNEELQSVNEELQSVNEELHTVNAENQSKIIELIELNNDLDNLMSNTRIATLFLDENLTIRRFTPEIKRVFKILDTDVGRPVNHFIHNLVDIDPFDLIRSVATNANGLEREVRTQEGAWFLMRILPYHVGTEAISGVVLTFTDIGLLKTTRDALLDRETRLSSLYRAAPVGIGRIVNRVFLEVNDYMCQMLGYSREELIGHGSGMLYVSPEEFQAAGRQLYGQITTQGVGTVETLWCCKDGTVKPVLLNGSSINPQLPESGVTFTVLDLSTHRNALALAQESERLARVALDALRVLVAVLDEEGTIVMINTSWRAFTSESAGVLDQVTEGVYYLQVCDRVMGGDPEEAISFAEGIRAVLRGEQPEFMQTYCWHSPQEQRWFIGRATRLPGEGPIRVMVVHEPVSTGIEQHQS
jgi:two-component system CheB/CheR fusion protein